MPLRRWPSRTGSACSFRARPEDPGRRATREARVSCSGPSRARGGDEYARLETRECESGDGVTGRACAGWGGLVRTPSGPPTGRLKRAEKNRGKKRTFDRSRAGASPRSRVRRDSIAAASWERGKMRANANPPSRGSAPRVGSRARAPSAGRCSEKVHSHSGVASRHLANDQVARLGWGAYRSGEDAGLVRKGRVRTVRCPSRVRARALGPRVRARRVECCASAAAPPCSRGENISLFRFSPSHTGKQSHVVRHHNFEKAFEKLFGNFGGGWAGRS